MKPSDAKPRRPRQRGTSLLEVLIAMLLLAVGVLGMIGLKLVSLKYTGQSNSRAAAAIYATEILDRMRANPVRAALGQYNIALTDPPPPTPTGAPVNRVDLAQWRQHITESLPEGTGSVKVDPDDGSFTVELQWTDRTDQSSTPVPVKFSFATRL